MTRPFLTSLALGAALALTACGSQENTEADTAATDESAVDPNNPFAELETRMIERMIAAAEGSCEACSAGTNAKVPVRLE